MKTAVVFALLMLTECATAQTAKLDVSCIKKLGDTSAKLNWIAPTQYENNDP